MAINVAKTYAKFRGSTWFLLGLTGLICCSLLAHFLFGFDKDFGITNLFLSAEASLSLAFFTMLSDQQDAKFEAMLQQMQNNDQKVLEIVEDIEEKVDGD